MDRFFHPSFQEPLQVSEQGTAMELGRRGHGVNAYVDSTGSGTLWRWGCFKGKKKLSITTRVLLRLQGRWWWAYKERQEVQESRLERSRFGNRVRRQKQRLCSGRERGRTYWKRNHCSGNAHGQWSDKNIFAQLCFYRCFLQHTSPQNSETVTLWQKQKKQGGKDFYQLPKPNKNSTIKILIELSAFSSS